MRLGADADATEDEGLVDDLLCIVEEFLTTFDPFVFFLYFLVSSLTAADAVTVCRLDDDSRSIYNPLLKHILPPISQTWRRDHYGLSFLQNIQCYLWST
jgi:hypothetical protein